MSDKNNPPNILLALFIVGLNALTLVLFLGPVAMHELRERRLLRVGHPAIAEIVSMEETGNVFNDVPEIRIRVEVRPTHGAPFRSETLETLSALDLQTIRVGSTLYVRFDPEDTRQVAIVDPRL